MCSRERPWLVVVVLLTFCLDSTRAASVAVSRLTSLSATGQTSGDSFDLSDERSTFGPYDNSVGDAIAVPEGGATRAQASQQSDAGNVSGFARGAADAQVAEFDAIAARAQSSFEFVFDVINSSETLTLSGSVDSTFDGSARVAVLGGGGDTLFERFVDFGQQEQLTFDEDVLLAPGRYSVVADGTVNGTPVPNTAAFDVTFSASNPIPLPPAVWAGSMGLAVAWICLRKLGPR